MFKILVLPLSVFCLVFLASNCASPLGPDKSDSRKDSPAISIDTLIFSPKDSLGDLYVNLDFGEIIKKYSDSSGMGKAAAVNRTAQVIYKIKKLDRANFNLTDSLGRSLKSSYPIDSTGKCSVGIIRIPKGLQYRAEVVFSGKTICPWLPSDTLYRLANDYFSGVDTIDLRSRSSDTLKLILRENPNATYFVKIKSPAGKYAEGGRYSVVESWNKGPEVKAIYSGGELRHRIYCQNTDTIAVLSVNDDTGRVFIGFSFNIDSVINDDIIEAVFKADEGGSIIVNPILFEHQVPLKVTGITSRNGSIILSFNRSTMMYVGDSSIFRVTLGSDTANFAKKTELQGGEGYISWLPSQYLKSGSYQLVAEGLLDQYGNKSPVYSSVLSFQ